MPTRSEEKVRMAFLRRHQQRLYEGLVGVLQQLYLSLVKQAARPTRNSRLAAFARNSTAALGARAREPKEPRNTSLKEKNLKHVRYQCLLHLVERVL